MKVLLLGTGAFYRENNLKPRCIPMSQELYNHYLEQATTVVTLDFDHNVRPDIVARVHHEPWAHRVKE